VAQSHHTQHRKAQHQRQAHGKEELSAQGHGNHSYLMRHLSHACSLSAIWEKFPENPGNLQIAPVTGLL
jgi:hypothetical protein